MKDKNKETQPDGGSNLQGRIDDSRNAAHEKEADKADISQVDRQEGNLHNGELGGNFTKEAQAEK